MLTIKKFSEQILDVYNGNDHVASIQRSGISSGVHRSFTFRIVTIPDNEIIHDNISLTWLDVVKAHFPGASLDSASFGGQEKVGKFFGVIER